MKASRTAKNAVNSESKDTVAYAELLGMGHDDGLKPVATQLLVTPNDENGRLAIVKATVEVERGRFEALGDADPSSVGERFVPHLIRVAVTRAKARALRDAVNCGIVSSEELDGVSLSRGSHPGPGAITSRDSGPAHTASPPARPRGGAHVESPASGSTMIEGMTEAQRRYLFRILAGQGYERDEAKERLKSLFDVSSLSHVTKAAAIEMIDTLLHSGAGNRRSGNGRSRRASALAGSDGEVSAKPWA